MNRLGMILIGPEVTLGLFTAAVFWFCARHNSYSSEDVRTVERFLWLLPVLAVPLAFATIYAPGAKTWWTLGRANMAVAIALTACTFRVVNALGAPGSGPRGEEGVFTLMIAGGMTLTAIANAFLGAAILRAARPVVATWFQMHAVAGLSVTVAACLPIFIAQLLIGGVAFFTWALVTTVLKR